MSCITIAKHPKSIWNHSLLTDFIAHPEKYKLSEQDQKLADNLAEEYMLDRRIRDERNNRNW